ncbi:hypothetical protein HAU46_10465 [Weissella confusa]|uniref:hypothetical protein n=1 Tax=Weissella confusa TaxID=1583 RepID=UPI0018F23549|nr:hypothetical protein [Weissella confusa]MBJ7648385.1 hypothetical protein [Weissella confusa]MBJ7680905.1 hypothetical protein [Weissella confusa]
MDDIEDLSNAEEVELRIPSQISIDVFDPALFMYDVKAFQLSPLQKAAETSLVERTTNLVVNNISAGSDVKQKLEKKDPQMVVQLSELAKEKLASGEWKFAKRVKDGSTYGSLVDSRTNRTKQFVDLKPEVTKSVSNLQELAAIQQQLASIAEQIEDLSTTVRRVEQGQYNDRYAGFFSARQQIIEAFVTEDPELKRIGFKNATMTANNTLAQLMLTMRTDIAEYINPTTKTKQAQRIGERIGEALTYINATVQLNLMANTAIGEKRAVEVTLANYKGFLDNSFLIEDKYGRSIAKRIDEYQKGDSGTMAQKIGQLMDSIEGVLQIENKDKKEMNHE